MKCKGKFIKLSAILLLGFIAVNLFLTGMGNTLTGSGLQPAYEVAGMSLTSEPLVYLFRILFILFIISPPLIVLMLVLIWKELRAQNKMK